jgi:hypothetical protein
MKENTSTSGGLWSPELVRAAFEVENGEWR